MKERTYSRLSKLSIFFNILTILTVIALFGVGIWYHVTSHQQIDYIQYSAVVLAFAGLTFTLAVFGCCVVSTKSPAIVRFYIFLLALLTLAEICFSVIVFVTCTTVGSSMQSLWYALSAAGRESLEHEFKCCGFDTVSANAQCEYGSTCKVSLTDYLSWRLNMLGIFMMIVSVVQIFNLILARALCTIPMPNSPKPALKTDKA